jgi:hypothetical protein
MQLQGKYPAPIAKTANFTVDPTRTRCGQLFTTRGAGGAVQFTLPQLSGTAQQGGTWDGYWLEFANEVDQNMTVACTAGKAICDGNAAATSLACSTASHKIGGRIRATWDTGAAKWLLSGVNVGVTYTVA